MNIITPGRLFIEALMVDECRIDRDYQGPKDDILDIDTGKLITPASDKTTVYAGQCILTHLDRKELEYINAEEPLYRKMYRVHIPLAISDVRSGDIFTLTGSGPAEETMEHDQFLLGKEMRVEQVIGGTFRGYRTLRVEDIRQDRGVTYR